MIGIPVNIIAQENEIRWQITQYLETYTFEVQSSQSENGRYSSVDGSVEFMDGWWFFYPSESLTAEVDWIQIRAEYDGHKGVLSESVMVLMY